MCRKKSRMRKGIFYKKRYRSLDNFTPRQIMILIVSVIVSEYVET
jgi:hypothetical protein